MAVGPFDASHWYLQWSGTLPGAERFSCGLRLAFTTGTPRTPSAGDLAAAQTAVIAYHTAYQTKTSARALLNSVKLNQIGTDGRYTSGTTLESVFADQAGVGTPADSPPNQVALVVSLTTAVRRGPANRGRFYMPMPVFPIGVDGRYAAADMVAYGTTTDTFIAALNAIALDYKVSVFSRKLGAPTHRLVTGNEIGRVPDTQRRRRRSLIEDYR